MRIRLVGLISVCSIITAVASCSVYQDYEASRPANLMKIETRLEQAGFQRVPIETPEQNGAVAQLPLYRLNRYQSAEGSVFWFADPTVCSCLYQGDQKAYERYVGLLQQEQDTAEYMNDERPEQVAYLGSFGNTFPPPVFLGAWPVMNPGGGGPVHSRGGGGNGGGVHSRGGGHGGGHGGVHGHH